MKFHPHDSLLLEAFGSLSREQRRPVLEHLDQCARCRERLKALHGRKSSRLSQKIASLTEAPTPPGDYDSALDQAWRRFRSRQAVLARERSEAPKLFAKLLEESPERREWLVRKDPKFQTWGLLEDTLEEGNRAAQKEPSGGEPLVRLALTLAGHLDKAYYGRERIEDLQARAWSVLGNTLRMRSELPAAEEAFGTAEDHLRRGTGDRLERAGISNVKSSLWRAQGRFDDAIRILERALAIYTEAGECDHIAKTLLNMDFVLHKAGRSLEGLPLLYRALDLIDPSHESTLLCVWHNLADNLISLKRFMEAQRAISKARPLYARYPGYPDRALIPKGFWIEGRLALGLGQFGHARELLLSAREGLAAHGVPCNLLNIDEELRIAKAGEARNRAGRLAAS